MSRLKQILFIALTVAGVILLVGFGVGLVSVGMAAGLPFLLLLMLFYGWMLSVFLHYRAGRQDEMLQLLSAAAESQAPLAPALWAYLRDRPQGPLREFWVAVILFFVLPGYYWVWHRRHSYDQKVTRVAYFLEMGDSLPHALQSSPGVVSRDMALAVQVGQHTGRLAFCLRSSLPRRLGPVWLELLPRLIYPVLLLMFISVVMWFWMIFILPRMQKIYSDFGQRLPEETARLAEVGSQISGMAAALPVILLAGILGALLLGAALYLSSTLRWHLPIVSRVYRRQAQSHVLKMLALLLEAGTPVPEALAMLADSGAVAPVVRRRLRAAQRHVELGEPLADSLRLCRLLPPSFVPLVYTAERVHNLPWALAELADTLADRSVRALRRFSQFVFPLVVVTLGLLVGTLVIGMFMPVIRIITGLLES